MKSGRVTGRKQATNSLKVNTRYFVTQIPYRKKTKISTLNIISRKCYDFHALFLYDEILGLK